MRTPLWQAQDEPAHYNYVRDIAQGRGFPEMKRGDYNLAYLEELKAAKFPPDKPVASLRYESHQPPLFYLLAALPIKLALGASVETHVLVLRLFSLAIGVVPILSVYFLARALFPEDDFIQAGAPVLMLAPQHIAVAASVNNDMLAEAVLSVALLGLVQLVATESIFGLDFSHGVFKVWSIVGVTLGVVLLSKVTIYFALLLAAVALLLIWRPFEGDTRLWRGWAVTTVYAYIVALAISGVWFNRNVSLYDWPDFTGLMRHQRFVMEQPSPDGEVAQGAVAFVLATFKSFWLQLGWADLPAENWVYLFFLGLTALAVFGLILFVIRLVLRRTRLEAGQMHGLVLLGLAALLVFLSAAIYNLQFMQPQGRRFFPAMPALSILFAIGLSELFGQRLRWPVLFLAAAGLVAINVRAIASYLPLLAPPG